MTEKWRVHNNNSVANVPYDLAVLYGDARHRVLHSRRLAIYLDTIMSDAYVAEDHLRWVIRGKVDEIEAWAKKMANP